MKRGKEGNTRVDKDDRRGVMEGQGEQGDKEPSLIQTGSVFGLGAANGTDGAKTVESTVPVNRRLPLILSSLQLSPLSRHS